MSEKIGLKQEAINAGIMAEIWKNIAAYAKVQVTYDPFSPYSVFDNAKAHEDKARIAYTDAMTALRENNRSHYQQNAKEVRRAVAMSYPVLICDAIKQCRRIEFVLSDTRRIVAPYAVYFEPRNRSLMLDGRQAEPTVSKRRFLVQNMTDLHVLHESFIPSVAFEPNDMKHRYIVCCVDYM